jgi:hypothetical protein
MCRGRPSKADTEDEVSRRPSLLSIRESIKPAPCYFMITLQDSKILGIEVKENPICYDNL